VSDAREDDAVELPITSELDLHSFAPREIASLVEEYLRVCREKGILEVRLVHGRGKGVQRAAVRRLLGTLESVAEFREAPPESGGWGATLVTLRREAPEKS
jgi:DNA-nicking Smr family endonuclease